MKVGFIGIGAIGYPIFQHVVENFDVVFFARRQEVIDKATNDGGVFVPSVKDVAEQSDAIILFVNTFAQCKDCVNQILSAKNKNLAILVGATVAPFEVESLRDECSAQGVALIDGPVTGGVKGAIDATLTTMISGGKEDKELFRPIISTYSKKIVDAGDTVGQAEALKALVQLLVGINSVAMSEAFTLGVKSGLDPEIIYDTITNSAGTSRIFENRGEKVMDRDFDKRGTIEIINKDMTICSQLAFEKKSPMFLGAVAKQMFQIAASQSDPLEDFNAVVKVYEKMAGIKIERTKK
ncbi:MAG: NAD(P)-dependent oxidoreductase [Clostridia bacterium]|nr:NAD(P)-dependent oxidoreductase [Clostridia bacterium]